MSNLYPRMIDVDQMPLDGLHLYYHQLACRLRHIYSGYLNLDGDIAQEKSTSPSKAKESKHSSDISNEKAIKSPMLRRSTRSQKAAVVQIEVVKEKPKRKAKSKIEEKDIILPKEMEEIRHANETTFSLPQVLPPICIDDKDLNSTIRMNIVAEGLVSVMDSVHSIPSSDEGAVDGTDSAELAARPVGAVPSDPVIATPVPVSTRRITRNQKVDVGSSPTLGHKPLPRSIPTRVPKKAVKSIHPDKVATDTITGVESVEVLPTKAAHSLAIAKDTLMKTASPSATGAQSFKSSQPASPRMKPVEKVSPSLNVKSPAVGEVPDKSSVPVSNKCTGGKARGIPTRRTAAVKDVKCVEGLEVIETLEPLNCSLQSTPLSSEPFSDTTAASIPLAAPRKEGM